MDTDTGEKIYTYIRGSPMDMEIHYTEGEQLYRKIRNSPSKVKKQIKWIISRYKGLKKMNLYKLSLPIGWTGLEWHIAVVKCACDIFYWSEMLHGLLDEENNIAPKLRRARETFCKYLLKDILSCWHSTNHVFSTSRYKVLFRYISCGRKYIWVSGFGDFLPETKKIRNQQTRVFKRP
jgi:hypothetical protein